MSEESKPIEYEGQLVRIIGKVGECTLLESTTMASGITHFEATCASKEARDKLAAIFEQEAILRVKPAAPVTE